MPIEHTQNKDSHLNLGLSVSSKSFTAGEAINASSTPQAVYLKASDGKIYKAIASADESVFKFVGFVAGGQNVAADASVDVTQSGIVSGFSGLTTNAPYFIDNSTAGAITTTPPNTRNIEVGIAVSATEIFLYSVNRKFARTSSSLSNGTGNGTNTITIGFRPRVIIMMLTTTGNDTQNSHRSGLWVWSEGGNSLGMRFYGTTGRDFNSFSDWMPAGYSDLSLSIVSITDTSFGIQYQRDSSWTSSYSMQISVLG